MMGDPNVIVPSSEASHQHQQVLILPSSLEVVKGGGGGGGEVREYRKGNWSLEETAVLIAAKRLDDERRMKGGDRNKTTELRWKWVENYCWNNGCQRNHNQCNDKWDNLLRDYKKVRDYQLRLLNDEDTNTNTANNNNYNNNSGTSSPSTAITNAISSGGTPQSYWKLEKHERKEKGLPSNLDFQVYKALHEVVDKRYLLARHHLPSTNKPHPVSSPSSLLVLPPVPYTSPSPAIMLPPQQHHYQIQSQHRQMALLPAHTTANGPGNVVMMGEATTHDSTEVSEEVPRPSSSPPPPAPSCPPPSPCTKRHKKAAGWGEAITRSTHELSEAILGCEERKEKRHRALVGVEERKVRIEETKVEMSKQGMGGLINALNNLATAILTLAASQTTTPPHS